MTLNLITDALLMKWTWCEYSCKRYESCWGDYMWSTKWQSDTEGKACLLISIENQCTQYPLPLLSSLLLWSHFLMSTPENINLTTMKTERERQREGWAQQLVSIKPEPGHCSPKGKIQHKRPYWWPRSAASFAVCVRACVRVKSVIALCSQWKRWKLHIDWKAALCPLYCWAANPIINSS